MLLRKIFRTVWKATAARCFAGLIALANLIATGGDARLYISRTSAATLWFTFLLRSSHTSLSSAVRIASTS